MYSISPDSEKRGKILGCFRIRFQISLIFLNLLGCGSKLKEYIIFFGISYFDFC